MARERSSKSRSKGKGGGGEEKLEKFRQGETPGAGEYECVSCDPAWRVTLDSDDKRLPPCGRCGPGTTAEYERI